jgi:hypothetical protein
MDNHCFLFALQGSDQETILDAYLVVASDRERAEVALRHRYGITSLGCTRCLGEWDKHQVAARCWIEATKYPIPLTRESAHSLADIVWD